MLFCPQRSNLSLGDITLQCLQERSLETQGLPLKAHPSLFPNQNLKEGGLL